MTDDPFVPRRKLYRKRKKSEGVSWSPDIEELEKAKRDKGPLCKNCHKTRRWAKLDIRYERLANGTIQRVMYCDGCGAALRTADVGSTNTPLTRDNCKHSIITSPPNARKGKPVGDDSELSAKEAAIQLGTDARTLRKFLRSKNSPFEAVGQGARYTFTPKEMKKLRKAFDAWGSGSTKKEIETAQPKGDHVEEIDLDEDEDEMTEPTDDEIMELDDMFEVEDYDV